MQRLKIDDEFKSLIAPLAHDEYVLLEASIKRDGCRDPLVTWQGILIDGHHRYKICKEHKMYFDVEQIKLEDRYAAIKWMIANQLGRRNLSGMQQKRLWAKRYKAEVKEVGSNQYSEGIRNSDPLKTADKLGKEYGVTGETIHQANRVDNALNIFESLSSPVVIDEVTSRVGLRFNDGRKLTEQDVLTIASIHNGNEKRNQPPDPKRAQMIVDEVLTGSAAGLRGGLKYSHQLIHQSKSNEWYTPSEYIEASRRVMGSIDLDPASCEYANDTVMAVEFFDKEDDGLSQAWYGNVWLNPPYGRGEGNDSNQSVWSNRLIEEYESANINQAILLVNAAPGSLWFYPFWNYAICFPKQRIKFNDENGASLQPTHGNAIVYLGHDIKRFAAEFEQFGAVVLRIRSK